MEQNGNSGVADAIRELSSRMPKQRTEIKSEPLTYERHSQHSYFRDLALRETHVDSAARLNAHAREMAVVTKELRKSPPPELELEYRINPNLTPGTGGYFAPPLWIEESYAGLPRPGQCLTRLMPRFDLPSGVSSINTPKVTAGVTVAPTPPGTDVPTTDVKDEAITQPVVSFEGNADWSLQNLEQSPATGHLDWAVFKELNEAYYQSVEEQIFTGKGSTYNQFTGILNLSGINTVTFTEGTPKVEKAFESIGAAVAKAGNKRRMAAEAIVMNTARLVWLGAAESSAQRPLLLNDNVGVQFPTASLISIPVYTDDAIPHNLGASGEQDVVAVLRPSDALFFESDHKTGILMEPLSGTLQVRFSFHAYATVLFRYPTGIAIVEGTGMKVASSYQ